MPIGSILPPLPLVAAILLATVVPVAAQNRASAKPAPGEPLKAGAMDNVYRLTPEIYSSSQPETDADFDAIKRLGVTTIITVDGSAPNVELAKKHGLRYIHLPMGYESLPPEEGLRLAKAVETSPGPVLIHCHHGKHRGPAAAAAACIATQNWTNAKAIDWLHQAGISPNYRQLIDDIEHYRPPSKSQLAAASTEFPERVPPPPYVDAMVSIDNLFDSITKASKAGFPNLATEKVNGTAHNAILLAEQFRELTRSPVLAERPAELQQMMTVTAADAEALQKSLHALESPAPPAGELDRAQAIYAKVAKSCTACHAKFRNNAGR
jgi:protein tyrosine phosphatase (PTP) superfamily phosphohydrolase (DUF442 family)